MLTLAIVKPHCLKNPFAYETIHQLLAASGLKVVEKKRVQLSRAEAEQFYDEHRNKFFFRRLVSLMTSVHESCYIHSGPSEVILLSGNDSIRHWRELMGPTKVLKTVYSHPECIRSIFGITDTRNAVHGSDSEASVAAERKFFFG